MHDHEKLKKIADIRKRREDKAFKKNKQLQKELYDHECKIEDHKQKMQQFLESRSVQIQRLQNQMRTEAMTGHSIESYLLLKEKTKLETDEYYNELERITKEYYPLLDKVNESYKEWEKLNISRVKLDDVATKKASDFLSEKTLQEELDRYKDFFGSKNEGI